MFHNFLDAELCTLLPPSENVVENNPRHKDRSKKVRQQTDSQRYGKSSNRTRSESEKNEGRDDCGYVGINDRVKGVLKPPRYGRTNRLPQA